tara:strand:- start:476 stop:907 length:432 start_codon:yes stop_codon:yes gene_type:complete
MAIKTTSGEQINDVLRVWNTAMSADFNTTSFVAPSNNSITLSPQSTSNKILITANVKGTMATGTSNGGFRIRRGGNEIKTGGLYANPGGIRSLMHTSCTYIDAAHNTTSSTTWDIQFRCLDGGGLGYSSWWLACDFTIMELAS